MRHQRSPQTTHVRLINIITSHHHIIIINISSDSTDIASLHDWDTNDSIYEYNRENNDKISMQYGIKSSTNNEYSSEDCSKDIKSELINVCNDQNTCQFYFFHIFGSKPAVMIYISPDNINNNNEEKEQSQSNSVASSIDPIVTTSKRLSIDPETAFSPSLINEHEEESFQILSQSRSRRNRNKISYRDESSSDNESNGVMSESDDENSEYNDTIFSGLNKKERIELRNKMNGIHSNYSDAIRKERELKLTQTICSVEFNIGHNITNDF